MACCPIWQTLLLFHLAINKGKKPKSALKESDSESEDGEEVGELRLTVDDIAVDEDELDNTVGCHLLVKA